MSNRCEGHNEPLTLQCGQCIGQLRSELAAVKADRDEHAKHRANLDRKLQDEAHWYHDWEAERAAHAETRKALDDAAQQMADFAMRCTDDITSARASEAALRERVEKALDYLKNTTEMNSDTMARVAITYLTADPTGQEGENGRT